MTENQTVWKSDSEIKKKHSSRPVGGVEMGSWEERTSARQWLEDQARRWLADPARQQIVEQGEQG